MREAHWNDGPPPRTTRAWRWMHPRALVCVRGHRRKEQPFAIGVVGLECVHRAPAVGIAGRHPREGAVPCASWACYLPFPERARVLAIECTERELATILERGMTRADALAFLGVELPEGIAEAA